MAHFYTYSSREGITLSHKINNTSKNDLYHGIKHSHPAYEIYLLLEGGVSYTVNGQVFPLRPYDLIVLDAYEFHQVIPDEHTPYERVVLELPHEMLPRLSSASPLDALGQGGAALILLPREEILASGIPDLLDRLKDACLSKNAHFRDYRVLSLTLLLVTEIGELLAEGGAAHSHAERARTEIDVCVRYINENLCSDICVDDVVAQLHISRSRIQHLFKSVMGYSLSSFIRKQKMQLAASLLKTGKTPSEVAVLLGYEYYATFHSTFKRFYGFSPKEQAKGK